MATQFNGVGTTLTAPNGDWVALLRTISIAYSTEVVDFTNMGSGRLGNKQQSAFANMTVDMDGLLLFGKTKATQGNFKFTFMDTVTIDSTTSLVTTVGVGSILDTYGFSTNFSVSIENDTEATFSCSLQIVSLAAGNTADLETASPYHA